MSLGPAMSILDPGVLETGLLSIVGCPVCAENLRASLNRADIFFNAEPWEPKPCPSHPDAQWR